jgi:hypothetical protein
MTKHFREAAMLVPPAGLSEEFVEKVFDEVAGLICRTFGLTRDEANVLLADTKADALIAFDKIDNDDLDAIAFDDSIPPEK